MAKILFLVAREGFQTKEYNDPKEILMLAGHTVVTASRDGGIAVSNVGEQIETDLKLSDVVVADYDGVFIIGGPGCLTYLDNVETVCIMREAKVKDKIIYGAICVAPRILAKAKLLDGIRITGWDNDGKLGAICENGGCVQELRPVMRDGRVITANGPQSAKDFGDAIVAALAVSDPR